MSEKLIKRVKLQNKHIVTEQTKHFLGKHLLPKPNELSIVRFNNESEVYLYYMDADGNEMTDTLHDSVDDAVKQAKLEFGIEPSEWENFDE